jgi:CheY-like chemotaxis protein/nitrogen-specific signal transduction histidine kinase
MSRVLIVDNDAALAEVLAQVVAGRMSGVEADACTSGAAALERITDTEYDAVAADIKMPGMDGLQLLAEIGARWPDLPTLMVTGHGDYDIAVRALRSGAYDFITKPIDRDYFLAAIRRAIQAGELSRRVKTQQAALQQYADGLEHLVEERTRELREANRVKDRILSMLSHELRAPLTPILGWAAILIRQADPRRVRHAMEVIDRNVRLQLTLVDDLLDVARMADGSIVLDAKLLDLRAVVRSAVATVSDTAWQKAIRVDATLPSEPVAVEGDAGRLCQILANILWNAVKFTPRNGRVAVKLSLEDDCAVVKVRDNGAGIAPEFLPCIFQVFSQQEEGTRREHGGLGVGLALAKHLTERHRGTIQAASAGLGRGAEFTVRLPLARQGTRTLPGGVMEPDATLPRLDGTTILLVEDAEDATDATRVMLESLGATVVSAMDGLAALTALDRQHPDVILCDLRLPVMDGFEFIERLRANPSRSHLPVIAVTAVARAADYSRTRAAGFDGLLTKPFDYRSLVAALRALPSGRGQKQAS